MHRLIAVAALLCASSSFAQTPYLVHDINTSYTPNALSSSPSNFTAAGATTVFTAKTDATGAELFRTDGTTVELLKDLVTGPVGSSPANFLALDANTVLFAADANGLGLELWKTDGSAAGTVPVKDIVPGGFGSNPFPVGTLNGKAFVIATTSASGVPDVWITDGTEGGTQQLVATQVARGFVTMGGFMYFATGSSLWKSDGTPGGTTEVRNDVTIRAMNAVNGKLIMAAWDATHGYELWVSDGTSGGTVLLRDINLGANGAFSTSTAFNIGLAGSAAVFFAYDATTGWNLWRTDGTAGGTYSIASFGTSVGFVAPAISSANGSAFFMSAGLWRTDGSEGGTFKLAPSMSEAHTFVAGPLSRVYFFGRDTNDSFRLWSTDGGMPGTAKVSSIVRAGSNTGRTIGYSLSKLYFSGSDNVTGDEPWTTDGTANGTTQLANLISDPPASSTPADIRGTNGKAYFTASTSGGRDLWVSDGSPAGTLKLADAFSTASSFQAMTAWKGHLFFTRVFSYDLWHTDGTPPNTGLLKTGSAYEMFASSGYFYFNAPPQGTTSSWYSRLWRSDGTEAGTVDLGAGAAVIPYNARAFVEAGGRVYFEGGDPRGIWRTEGTPETTVRITTHPGCCSPSLGTMAAAGGALYYSMGELYRLDLGSNGALTSFDLYPGVGIGQPAQLTPAGGLLFFTAVSSAHGRELWRTDGTEAGTFMLRDIQPGSFGTGPLYLTAVDDKVFFTTTNGIDGYELWVSDGTVAGTVMVADIAPGALSSNPEYLVAGDGYVWFAANDSLTGIELWKSNGTAGGTQRVMDIEPGSFGSSPGHLSSAGRRIYFAATTMALGRELWAVDLSPTAFRIDDARVTEGPVAQTRTLRFTISRVGDVSGAATVPFSTSNGSASGGSDYATQNGVASFGAGVASVFADIVVNGDNTAENDETLFVTLGTPSSGAVDRRVAVGIIEDDDHSADLTVAYVHTGNPSSSSWSRTFVVTNLSGSTASAVSLRVTESPATAMLNGTNCTPDGWGAAVCAIGTLVAGESRTIVIGHSSNYSTTHRYDTNNPPGYTVTAVVSSPTNDPVPSNNSVSKMLSGNWMLPPYLLTSSSATLTYQTDYTSSSATSFPLGSSNANVTINPNPMVLPAYEQTATTQLQTNAVTGKTTISRTNWGPQFAVAIVSDPSQVRLDPILVTNYNYSSFPYGSEIEIPVRVAGRRADGAYPTGTIALLDRTNNVLQELALDAEGEVVFELANLQPGSHELKLRYDGDGAFYPLTAAYPVSVSSIQTSMTMSAPLISCTLTVEVTVYVIASTGNDAPTGQISVGSNVGTIQAMLQPTGVPRQAKVTVQLPIATNTTSISAAYAPNPPFNDAWDISRGIYAGCAAMNLVATAVSPTRVDLSWTSTGAQTYDVYRLAYDPQYSYYNTFNFLGYAGTNSYIDNTVQPGRLYIYRVRPTGGTFSAPDMAVTTFFTDDPIVPGSTKVRASHFTELLTTINLVRGAAGLPAASFANPPASGNVIDTAGVTTLRTAIAQARTGIGLPAVSFTDPSLAAGMWIKAAHVQELRNSVK